MPAILLNMNITFTPGEITVLQHRLAVPDAIADSLSDFYTGDDIVETAMQLDKKLVAGQATDLNELEVQVLRDCVDSSTWFANYDQWPAHECATWSRVADSLESKLGVSMPRA
jgi:hypothetical protein